MDQDAQQVLAEIINAGALATSDPRLPIRLSPDYDDLVALAGLLSRDPREEELQKFLEVHPQFLLSMFGDGDGPDVAFIAKPKIGTLFVADFGIMTTGQGGSFVHLIEIERSGATLFTQKNTPAETLQSALGQIDDWRQWITVNQQTFTRSMVDLAKTLAHFHDRRDSASFRLVSPEHIEQSWRSFGGYDHTAVRFSIIIGRWGLMSEAHRKRLIYLNQRHDRPVPIFTFDELARRAYARRGYGF